MAHSKQANKRIRQNEKARERNKMAATAMKSSVKRLLRAPSAEEAGKALPEAMKRIDKAAKQGVIHKNTAARRKSRLARTARAAGSARPS